MSKYNYYLGQLVKANNQTLKENWPFAIAIFLSAFLLFQVELILSKYILPWFGGSPSVWTTSMLTFQILLLIGYIYAHFLAVRLPLPLQKKVHLLLSMFSVLLLVVAALNWPSPITPGFSWKPHGDSSPILNIILLLIVAIGLPFFLLSATSPLFQQWFLRSQGAPPYRLFALSNMGSLLGLLTYPFLIEPKLTIKQQAWIWTAGYLIYFILGIFCAIITYSNKKVSWVNNLHNNSDFFQEEGRLKLGIFFLWISLAACGCIIFLATTNMLCQEIAVIPFLWVLPLSLYLITFIACFESDRWYRRGFFHILFPIGLTLLFLIPSNKVLPQVGGYSFILFIACMICHGELSRLKPSGRFITHYYLMIALGGALGGIFVAIIAPMLFPAFWEFQLALLGCGVLLFITLYRDHKSWFYTSSNWIPIVVFSSMTLLIIGLGFIFPAIFSFFSRRIYLVIIWGIVGVVAIWITFRPPKSILPYRWNQITALGILILAASILFMDMYKQIQGSFVRFRSFFGVFRVEKRNNILILKHGQTTHGFQIRDGIADPTPTSYYATNTGIGKLLWNHPKRQMNPGGDELRVGIVGLGTGTLAAYGRPGDYYCFYEIDPKILRISQGHEAIFTFIKNSSAKVEVILGDGRLSLEKAAELGNFQKFDVLILDAFSSDSIPVHLLTREAMELYLKHLRDQDSVIAFHISNRILDLAPVLKGLSREFNLALIIVNSVKGPITSGSRWGLLSRNPEIFEKIPKLKNRAESINLDRDNTMLWTDDYSNLWQVVSKKAWW
jgi:hypothetical protein